MNEVLKLINDLLSKNGINYQFSTYKGDLKYPYWVGEYSENQDSNEGGEWHGTLLLTGTTNNTWFSLEKDKTEIYRILNNVKCVLPSGSSLALFISSSFMIPTDVETIKRIQINVEIKNWRN